MLSVEWLEGDLLAPKTIHEHLGGAMGFDLVVSNPPYVRESEKKLMDDQVLLHEPGLALFVDDQDPLLYYRAIVEFCDSYLLKQGHVWLEINEQLGTETASLFRKAGYMRVEIRKDIHEKERFIHARK